LLFLHLEVSDAVTFQSFNRL